MKNTNNAELIALGAPKVGGAIFVAPAKTAIPQNAVEDLGSAFEGVGYCSEEGLKEQPTLTTTPIKDWSGGTVLEPVEEYATSFVVEFMETNAITMGTIYGEENVTGDEATAMKVVGNPKYRKEHVWVIEEAISVDRVQRTIIPRGKISSIAEIAHQPKAPIKYGITIKALLDADGNDYYKYVAVIDDSTTPPSGTNTTSSGETAGGDTETLDEGSEEIVG